MTTEKIFINDMQCTGCAGRAHTALMGVDGVVKVISSLDEHHAEVTYNERKVKVGDLLAALEKAGFESPSQVAD